jgi:hypothetical protein
MNLAHLLTNAARSFPERPAVSVGDHRLYDYTAYQRGSPALSATASVFTQATASRSL